jgi:hypothetical protein
MRQSGTKYGPKVLLDHGCDDSDVTRGSVGHRLVLILQVKVLRHLPKCKPGAVPRTLIRLRQQTKRKGKRKRILEKADTGVNPESATSVLTSITDDALVRRTGPHKKFETVVKAYTKATMTFRTDLHIRLDYWDASSFLTCQAMNER